MWLWKMWIWEMSSSWRIVYGYGRCLLAGEEYMAMEDVFLLEKNMFLWEKNMSCCWRRIYGYGRCLLVGEAYMAMEDAFPLQKTIWTCKMSSYIISYHITLYHIKGAYILLKQEDIFHYHIVFSNEKTSSIAI